MKEEAKRREQEELVLKRGVSLVSQDKQNDKLVIEVDINGLIAAKEGKDTHVVVSDNFKVIRSDGKAVTIQLNGWYK